MTGLPFIQASDVDHLLRWTDVADALAAGHRQAKADQGDLLLRRGGDAILNRAAWIDGLGIALKSVTIFPENVGREPRLESIQGLVILFDDTTGTPKALMDGALVTKWKTAGDSVLGARLLAPPSPKRLLILGAGVVARSLIEAYSEIFPGLERIEIWNRTPERAAALAQEALDQGQGQPVEAVADLAAAAGAADLIASATMSREPVIRGDWIGPGTHVDLIGAFTPEMREADDALLRKAELFVDSRETTLHDIGELKMPLEAGVIAEADIRGDLYDLCSGAPGRSGADAITLYKNGGGAHLDLMTATLIFEVFAAA